MYVLLLTQTQRLFTGGEDGKLLAWAFDGSTPQVPHQPVPDVADAPASTPPARPKHRTHGATPKRRYTPYS